MCRLCLAGFPQEHSNARRQYLRSTATGIAATGLSLLTPRTAHADNEAPEPFISQIHHSPAHSDAANQKALESQGGLLERRPRV